MDLKDLVKLELPHIKKVINDLHHQGLSSGALPVIYGSLFNAVYNNLIPDLPNYSPVHNSLDAGDEDGVIAQKIYQNLVEKVRARLKARDRVAAKTLKSGFYGCYFMDSAISQSSKYEDFLEDLDERQKIQKVP